LLKACVNNILEGLGFIRVFREYGVACLSQSSALEWYRSFKNIFQYVENGGHLKGVTDQCLYQN
jgi:hypothetical protein